MQQVHLRKWNKGTKGSDAFHLAPSVSLHAWIWWVFCALVLAGGSGRNKSERVSWSVLGAHSSTTAVQLAVMFLVLFSSWTTEPIHKGLLGSNLKLSSSSMKEVLSFFYPNSTASESISVADQLMKEEEVKQDFRPYLGSSLSMCESLFNWNFPSLQRKVKQSRLDPCLPVFNSTFPWT